MHSPPGRAQTEIVDFAYACRLDAKRQQVAAAMERVQEEKLKIESEEGMDDMDEEERSEYVNIKKREFEQMEKMLAAKQASSNLCVYV